MQSNVLRESKEERQQRYAETLAIIGAVTVCSDRAVTVLSWPLLLLLRVVDATC